MDEPRRVVTGHDENGRAIVVLDAGPGTTLRNEVRAVDTYDLWATDASPAPIPVAATDPSAGPIHLEPEPFGSAFRIVDFHPDPFSRGATADADTIRAAFGAMGAAHASNWQPGAHPGMHRTETVDYGIVLEGEIDLVLDDGEVHLIAGDAVVQVGTNHAWVNRTEQTTRMAFVLIDGRFDAGLAAKLRDAPRSE
jgi:hypothetical protein